MLRCLLTAAVTVGVAGLAADDAELLLHYSFDGADAAHVADASGNGLDGRSAAGREDSPVGRAASMDGTPGTVVKVQIPEEKRFGTGSWTFLAWVKPAQFTIDDRQNQRRIFAFGTYPAAYLVIDIMGTGRLSSYFCYRDAEDRARSVGSSSSLPLQLNQWAQVAIVCDRENRRIYPYVNGFCSGSSEIAPDFTGDYVLGGELTLGSSWHNYRGLMDEVKVFRRALSKQDMRAEFRRLSDRFGATESPLALAAERRERQAEALDKAGQAWREGDYAAVREHCMVIRDGEDVSAPVRSYAHLRMAQSYRVEGNMPAALAEYRRIEAEDSYPAVHRFDAAESARELVRVAAGLPAHDPRDSRTRVAPITRFAAEVWVAPGGNDTADGSRARPFASLARARNAVRALRIGGQTGPIRVRIAKGVYPWTEPLALGPEDSGTPAGPTVYQAEELGAARLYGGTALTGFAPVTDPAVLARLPAESRDAVRQCDLRALGITDYGQLRTRGFGQPPSPPTMELYVDGGPMRLSRWPNEGFLGIRELVDPGSTAAGRVSVIGYESERPERWRDAEDLWLFGYFRYLWADACLAVDRIDTEARTLIMKEPYRYGGGMDTRQGIAYYAFNLLEEIDQPGEWYLNRDSGILYLYPPRDLAEATVEIGMLATPMIALNGVTDVRLEGLVLDLARYNGIVAQDCSRLLIAGCTVQRMAGNGITIRGGEGNMLIGCDVHTVGRRATEVIGGERETLTPGRHVVENCRIYNMGRIDRTYTPAIQLEGVGHRVAHNLMYDAPSSVMRIEGNDHIIEYNDVHSAVQESDDQGGMELFRNATYRGNVFRYNRYSNIGKTGAGAMVHGQAAIRFDDAISGMVVYGNLFVRSANGHFGAIQMNSGRDNIIDNNIFVDCRQGISGGWNPGNKVWRSLMAGEEIPGFFMGDLYQSRYPEMGRMLEQPARNFLWRNIFYRCGRVIRGNASNIDQVSNVVLTDADPGFVDAAGGDYRLKPDAPVLDEMAFRPIPLQLIGLYADRYRASWPVETTPDNVPDWR